MVACSWDKPNMVLFIHLSWCRWPCKGLGQVLLVCSTHRHHRIWGHVEKPSTCADTCLITVPFKRLHFCGMPEATIFKWEFQLKSYKDEEPTHDMFFIPALIQITTDQNISIYLNLIKQLIFVVYVEVSSGECPKPSSFPRFLSDSLAGRNCWGWEGDGSMLGLAHTAQVFETNYQKWAQG